MTLLLASPATLAKWMSGDRELAADLSTSKSDAAYVCAGWRDIDFRESGRLDVPGLRELSVAWSPGLGQDTIARLAASVSRQTRLIVNHVLLGDEEVHDERRGPLPSFAETMGSIRSLEGEKGHRTTVSIPLWPETVRSAFRIWHRLSREGIAFRFTLGRLQEHGETDRYVAKELLENLCRRESRDPRASFYYGALRTSLDNRKDLPGADVSILAEEDEVVALRRLLYDGLVPLPLALPPARWRLTRWVRDRNIDKLWTVMSGLPLLGVGVLHKRARRKGRVDHEGRASPPAALVLGWFGTETAGDKAILGGILNPLLQERPKTRVYVASVLTFYTQETVRQLGLESRVEVVPLDHSLLSRLVPSMDVVLIGGGPLMDLVEMFSLLRVFLAADSAGVPCVIAGCGIGPAIWPLTRWIIERLVRISRCGILRDEASLEELRQWNVDVARIRVGRDPAMAYVAEGDTAGRCPPSAEPTLGMAVREWQWKYGRFLGKSRFKERGAELDQLWAGVADWFVESFNGRVNLIPMHTLHTGGDDRWLHADIAAAVKHPRRIMQNVATYSAREIADMLGGCDLVISMRYHSVLFSAIRAVPFLAVDYTHGGKVAAFVREIGMAEWLLDAATVRLEDIQRACTSLWQQRHAVRAELEELRPKMIEQSRLAAHAVAEFLPVGDWP